MGWLAVVVVLLGIIIRGVRIIPEYQRLVVFRLGRCVGARGPGVQIVVPFLERAVSVDLRES
ncbi:MAG: slipin family protein, partial [Proteobacteria bacterium]|nr:slipin family protein [Pseudomonadota bacterium]